MRRSGRSTNGRRGIGCSSSTASLQPNHNGGGIATISNVNTHQKLSRFLSYKQGGSFRLHNRTKRTDSRSLSKSRSSSPAIELIYGKTNHTYTSVPVHFF